MKHKTLQRIFCGVGLSALVLGGWLFLGPLVAETAHAQPTCSITNPKFSPSGVGGTSVMDAGYHLDSSPSTLQFSAQIQDCAGIEVEVAVYSGSSRVGDFSTTPPSNSTGSATLTGALQTGELGCSGASNPDCRLSIRAYADNVEVVNTGGGNYATADLGIVGYFCDNFCDADFGPVAFTPPVWGSTGGGGATGNFLKLENPIQYDNIPDVIRQFITIVFVIGIPLVAFAIIYAGFLLVTAGGDQTKLKKGKQALLAGVIGGAVLLGAWVIAEAIQGTVDQIRGV